MTTGADSERVAQEQIPTSRNQNVAPSHLLAALQLEHPDWIVETVEAVGEATAVISREHIIEICSYLKAAPDARFDFLSDICGVDRGPEEEPRFEVNYHLFSTTKHHRLRLKVLLQEDDAQVSTVTGVWRTANWHERETFDLFGINFVDHPDLRRILLPDDWQGHALRKDFPLRGYEPYSLK